jgi:hypothetical protein
MNNNELQVLKLEGVILDKMPDNFKFYGTIDLTGSSIKELPKGLFVQEDLIIGDASINKIPENVIIGGDLIDHQGRIKSIDDSLVVGGKFFSLDQTLDVQKSNHQHIILDNGKKFFYKSSKYYPHEARNHLYNRTPFTIYIGYSSRFLAVSWQTPKGKFAKECESRSEAKFLVNYQDAVERGIEQYKGLDIDTPMLGHKILKIYRICTNACLDVVDEYLQRFNLDLNKYYTLREIGYTIQKFKVERYAPASDVFMKFFNIPKL